MHRLSVVYEVITVKASAVMFFSSNGKRGGGCKCQDINTLGNILRNILVNKVYHISRTHPSQNYNLCKKLEHKIKFTKFVMFSVLCGGSHKKNDGGEGGGCGGLQGRPIRFFFFFFFFKVKKVFFFW